MIKGLSHIAIRASDILASVRFYTETLGLREAFRMYGEDGALATVYLYIAPSQYLELFANGSRPADTGKDVIGLCHICLETEDAEKMYETLKAKGAPLDSEIRLGKSKCRMVWTHDPDGNSLEIMELVPESLQAQANARFKCVCVTLRDKPELLEDAARWFHEKWGVPEEAYRERMTAYLNGETEYGWYLCLDGERIVGGLGVIDNDFHDRKDLAPNVCAVYTEKAYRGRGIAGRLLNKAVEDLKEKGITPLYLVTDHTGFYERYGWTFLCMAQGDGEAEKSRVYVHR